MVSSDLAAQAATGLVAGEARGRLPGVSRLVGMELRKLARRPMTQTVFGIVTAATVFAIWGGYATISHGNLPAADRADRLLNFVLPGVIPNMFNLMGVLGMSCLAVLAAGVIGSEYSWGTVRVLVGSGVSRLRLIAAKWLAILAMTIAWVVLGLIVTMAAAAVLALVTGRPLTLGTVDAAWAEDLALMLGRTIFVLLVPATLGFAVALVARSFAAGIAVAIGWPFIEQVGFVLTQLLGRPGEILRDVMIMTNMQAVTALNGFGPQSVPEGLPDPWQAAGVLTLYLVVLAGISLVVFKRRDLASSS